MQAIFPSSRFVAVTKSDTVPVTYTTQESGAVGSPVVITGFKGLYVGVTGDVTVKNDVGTSVTFTGLAAGMIHPIAGRYVMSTGTGATNIVAIFS